MPTTEEVVTRFTVVDANDGFWRKPLNRTSRNRGSNTAINMPAGLQERDAMKLRYDWEITDTPMICACGVQFSVDHALSLIHI